MGEMKRFPPGTVSWIELRTPDLDGARAFYGALLGWSFARGDDPEAGFYTMAQIGGKDVAGLMKAVPASWTVYLATDDVDGFARRVADAGGSVVRGPMDIRDEGRMGIFADPTGAHFGAWQPRRHLGAQLIEEPGTLAWAEVYARDAARAREFYARVGGLEPKKLDAPGIDYFTMQKGERTAFGVMQLGPQFPKELPSHWNTYFAVTDVAAAARKVPELGGSLVAPPFDTPYGEMFVAADPAGAPFCLIKPLRPMSQA